MKRFMACCAATAARWLPNTVSAWFSVYAGYLIYMLTPLFFYRAATTVQATMSGRDTGTGSPQRIRQQRQRAQAN